MTKRQWTAAITALVMGASSVGAFAQPQPSGGHGPQQRPGNAAPAHKAPPPPKPAPQRQPAPPKQPAPPQHRPAGVPPIAAHMQGHGMPPGQMRPMGAGPQRDWVKGSRIPPQYRSKHYVVNDWRGHGLQPPPRGYHWVQYGADYLLVAAATGIITQLILGSR